jgi:hypothetical protein
VKSAEKIVELQDIVSMFYDSLDTKRAPDRVLELLSSSLQVEVAMHVSLPLLKSNPLFSGCSSGFVASLAVVLKERTMAADELLFWSNDICAELYMIASGNVIITMPTLPHQEPVRH